MVAVDVNERENVYGNGENVETKIEEAMRLVKHADKIQGEYSAARAQIWRGAGAFESDKNAPQEARYILADWACKNALKSVREAKSLRAAMAREDLKGLRVQYTDV